MLDDSLIAILIEQVEVGVSDEASQRHDYVILDIEASHFAINPY